MVQIIWWFLLTKYHVILTRFSGIFYFCYFHRRRMNICYLKLVNKEKEMNCFILCLFLFCRTIISIRMICFRPPKCCGNLLWRPASGSAAPTFHQSGWISSQTRCWKRLSHSICPSPTIKSERRKSPLAINTHWYVYSSSPRRLVSSLKAQSTAPPIIEPIVSDTKRRRRHRWLPKECEKGSLAIPTKSPNLYLFSSVV